MNSKEVKLILRLCQEDKILILSFQHSHSINLREFTTSSPPNIYTRARWKVLGQAYNQHETREKWLLSRDPDRSWCHHHTTKSFLGSSPWTWAPLQTKKLYAPFQVPTQRPLVPEFRISCRLGQELFTLSTYFILPTKHQY
jgi:hypothetical protein